MFEGKESGINSKNDGIEISCDGHITPVSDEKTFRVVQNTSISGEKTFRVVQNTPVSGEKISSDRRDKKAPVAVSIVYSDKDVLVCVKPAGMLSQSDREKEKGLAEILSEKYGETVYPVHRLDRPVAGLMVFARNKKAAAFLSGEVADGGSAVTSVKTGSALPVAGGSAVTSVKAGSALPAAGGSVVTSVKTGSALPAAGGSVVTSVKTGSALPAAGGSVVTSVKTGSALPAAGGSAVTSVKAGSALPAAGGNPFRTLFEKEYVAVVSGDCPEEGEMTDFLLKKDGKVYAVKTQRKGAKPAKLGFRVVSKTEYQGKTLSLVRGKLYTGRTHQIRVQFASRGMPVAGDGRYGSRLKCDNISLFSVKIAFIHPSTGEKTVFASEIPESGYFRFFADRNNT